MFGNSKPTASLSSGLLARKGQARPAMRPQGFHGPAVSLEDLGWNDMGEGPAPAAPDPAPAAELPPVLVQREVLREEIAAAPVPIESQPETAAPEPEQTAPEPVPAAELMLPEVKSVSVATAARIRREVQARKPKAAFTLRLDAERHLRLRLASATRNRSAQALVSDALDRYLETLPEVEELARQLPELRGARTSGETR